ncbi:MAG: gliding motility protein GldL [Chlorobi bacterium]|nr:gliding motility protein GldL [Chlorobiota bacterium]
MGFITEFVESPGYKKIMGKVYGWGAAVVLAGALFKIMHYPGAEIMLLLGMGTEIIIFFLSAFEPPHEQPDWSLVYPELRGLEPKGPRNKGGGGSDLAALVESGNLDQEVVEKLAEGIKKLAVTTNQLSEVSDASLATESYLQNIKQAGDAVGKFSNVQLKTAMTLEETSGKIADAGAKVAEVGVKVAEELSDSGKAFADSVKSSGNKLVETYAAMGKTMSQYFESINEGGKNFSEQLNGVNKNLSAINAAYELQLKGLNEQVNATHDLTQGLNTIKEHMSQSVEDSKEYREQIAALSRTIGELNSIYGNMLSAMNVGRK